MHHVTQNRNASLEGKASGHKYSSGDVDAALVEISCATESLLLSLQSWYNQEFKLTHDVAYYRRVLGPFLVAFLPAVYDHWMYPSAGVAMPVQTGLVPLEPVDFVHLARFSDCFHAQIRADLDCVVEFTRTDKRQVWYCERSEKPFWQRFLSGLESIPAKVYRPRAVHFLTPTCRRDRLLLALRTCFSFGPAGGFDSPTQVGLDHVMRRRIAQAIKSSLDAKATPFTKVVSRILSGYLPVALLEDFRVSRDCMTERCESFRPTVIVTGFGLLTSSRFSIWASECASRGTKIVGWQHGGTYGEAAPTSSESLERRIVDIFLTWGWDDGAPRTIPVPCPRQSLVSKNAKRDPRASGMLWVTTSDSRHVYAIHHQRFGRRFEDYFEHQRNLYDSLPEPIQRKISVRRYRDNFDHPGEDHWDRPDMAADMAPRNQTLVNQARTSELTIIDHYGATSFLECMLADVPTILVGPLTHFEPRPTSKAAFDELFAAGIAHKDIASARDFIVRHESQYLDWWLDKRTRRSRDSFVRQFCQIAGDYRMQWIHAIEKS